MSGFVVGLFSCLNTHTKRSAVVVPLMRVRLLFWFAFVMFAFSAFIVSHVSPMTTLIFRFRLITRALACRSLISFSTTAGERPPGRFRLLRRGRAHTQTQWSGKSRFYIVGDCIWRRCCKPHLIQFSPTLSDKFQRDTLCWHRTLFVCDRRFNRWRNAVERFYGRHLTAAVWGNFLFVSFVHFDWLQLPKIEFRLVKKRRSFVGFWGQWNFFLKQISNFPIICVSPLIAFITTPILAVMKTDN